MTTTSTKDSKTQRADLATQLVAGTQKHLANLTQLMFGSGTFTPAQTETQLTRLATLRSDVEAAKVTVKAKLAAETAQAPALIAFQSAFIAFVKATFSQSPDVLADFGLTPKKARTPLTVEQKAAAKAKRAATREARGTMGTVQKRSVKGAVTGVTITPVTSTDGSHSASAVTTATAPAPVPSTSNGAISAAATSTSSHGA